MNAILQEQSNLQVASPLQQFFSQDLYMSSPAGFEGMDSNVDQDSQHYFQSTHSVRQSFEDEMMNERRMSQPDLQMYGQQRPTTPAQQMNTAHLPLTPATTPFKQNSRQYHFSRTAQSSPVRLQGDKTIKAPHPILMQRGRSLEGIFEAHDEENDIPSPPGTAPMISSSTFEMAEMPMPHSMSSRGIPTTFSHSDGGHASLQVSPELAMTARDLSFPASSEGARTPLFTETGGSRPLLAANIPMLPSSQPGTGCPSPTKTELSPRRMSISDLNLEPGVSASIEETNVTLDDIAQFIEGPDPLDNKWICKYEDCNKKFGRKENIKSHVQTHLGDRQFRCDHCNKCFVRGHDLKRHAKIHTGSKPYPCLCGNAFARHDALTRHRQRGNCIGAFEGVVKKVVKKGRPRKHRPEMDDRLDKANRTRKRVEEKGHHYASSCTDSSISSFGSPPAETLESLSIRGASPFDDMSMFGVVSSSQHMSEVTASFPPDLFTFTPPASPGYSTGNKPSPYHRALTPTDMAEVPEIPTIQTELLGAINQESHQQRHHSPPSLCYSSSSPVPDVISFDFSSAEEPLMSNGGNNQRLSLKGESSNADFDSFFDYGNMGMDGGQDSFFNL
ncbi:hypothetical protein EPUS_07921 [Endocarpon pusillum Z07020]|uniref:C2H2-type domain-containing protein n=1 Tax=Endocarpon pusillum (strain Z07020 / HMAS-L-300199) TaxID=1263415 RepID=U1HT85_ENDPU|nr:uncharacterized protein EPUS_07921 [Endocarpon pusillum Z07020]ERF72464.1 hypothetical protein EPUS_07921 [Endocarpon pusillum Z07020]